MQTFDYFNKQKKPLLCLLAATALILSALYYLQLINAPLVITALVGIIILISLIAVKLTRDENHDPDNNGNNIGEQDNKQLANIISEYTLMLTKFVAIFPEPAFMLNSNDVMVASNQTLLDLFGDFKPDRPFYYKFRDPELLSGLDKAKRQRKTSVVEFKLSEPTVRWLKFCFVPLGDYRKQLTIDSSPAIFVCIIEQTKRRQIEQLHSEFVANVSHELRTPLTAIIGFIETLRNQDNLSDDKTSLKFLKIMALEAKRMSALIDKLLTLSRLELSYHDKLDTELNIGDILQTIVDSSYSLARKYKVKVRITKTLKQAIVISNHNELIQLFENIITNAIRYGAAGGKVDIALQANKNNYQITITDYGSGIAPIHIARITERFYRGDNKKNIKGSGLGLAIARQIIYRHKGELVIHSEPGKKTTFTVSLPYAN